MFEHHRYLDRYRALRAAQDGAAKAGIVVGTPGLQDVNLGFILAAPHYGLRYGFASEISNDLEVVRLL